MSEQLLKEMDHTVTVTMSGDGMVDTVGKIFNMMRKQVFQDINKPIIQRDTQEVYFDKVDVTEKKEAFLFIFMPRVRRYYTVTARIVLKVKYLDVQEEDK